MKFRWAFTRIAIVATISIGAPRAAAQYPTIPPEIQAAARKAQQEADARSDEGFAKAMPEIQAWEKNNHCPENDRLCQEAVWFFQTMFLGPRSDMDQIAEAVRKIHANPGQLAKVS